MLLPGIHVSVSCQVNNLFEITCRTGTYDHFWLFYIIHADLFYVFLLSKVFFLGDGNTLDCWRRRKLYALLCKDMLPWANINNFEKVILIFRQIDDGLLAVEMTLKKCSNGSNVFFTYVLTYFKSKFTSWKYFRDKIFVKKFIHECKQHPILSAAKSIFDSSSLITISVITLKLINHF